MKNQIVFSFVAALAIIGGILLIKTRAVAPRQVACTLEAKICPNGSAVGRVPPNCEFAPCPAGSKDSGIKGIVLLGPNCPVERIPPEEKCKDKPFSTNLVVTTEDGASVIREFTSGEDGTFNVSVPPGYYAIRSAETANVLPRCASEGSIVVDPRTYADIVISCDTGIR